MHTLTPFFGAAVLLGAGGVAGSQSVDSPVAAALFEESATNAGVDYAIEPVGHSSCDVCYQSSCACDDGLDFTGRIRTGLTYFDDALDSQLGAGYSLDMAMKLAGRTSAYLSASHNHFASDSQFLGTVGAFRQGTPCGDVFDRLSGGVLFDQYTDTRFDGLYVSQFRLFVGGWINECLAGGVTYTEAVEDDTAIAPLPASPTATTFRAGESVEGYLSAIVGENRITATAGSREDPDVFVGGLLVQRQIHCNLGVYAQGAYQESDAVNPDGKWAANIGLEWWFGPGSSRRSGRRLASASRDYVVRGQSGGSPSNPFTDLSLGKNLHYDAAQFASNLTGSVGGVTVTSTEVEEEGGGEEAETGGPLIGFEEELDDTEVLTLWLR